MMYGCTPYAEDEEMVKVRSAEELQEYYDSREEEYIPIAER